MERFNNMKLARRVIVGFCISLIGLVHVAQAQPVAIVEEVSADVTTLRAMDVLLEGERLQLPVGGKIVVDYFRSCLRETVVGGGLLVGRRQSTVVGGTVSREQLVCDGGQLQLTQSILAQSAGAAVRAEPSPAALDGIPLRVYDIEPLFLAPGCDRIEIRPTGGAGRTEAFSAQSGRVDLRIAKISLSPGQAYRASCKTRTIDFVIDSTAERGGVLLRRLVAF